MIKGIVNEFMECAKRENINKNKCTYAFYRVNCVSHVGIWLQVFN